MYLINVEVKNAAIYSGGHVFCVFLFVFVCVCLFFVFASCMFIGKDIIVLRSSIIL